MKGLSLKALRAWLKAQEPDRTFQVRCAEFCPLAVYSQEKLQLENVLVLDNSMRFQQGRARDLKERRLTKRLRQFVEDVDHSDLIEDPKTHCLEPDEAKTQLITATDALTLTQRKVKNDVT